MQRRSFVRVGQGIVCSLALAAASSVTVQATTPAHGSVYIGIAYGSHRVYKVEYDYDGADTFTTGAPVLVAYTPGAAEFAILPNRYLLVVGQGNMAKVKLPSGPVTTASPGNNANTVALDPDGVTAWAGWFDTALASIPLDPFGDGTVHTLSGDDQIATMIAFTPSDGAFYTNGGTIQYGFVGRIDLTTFHTTRLFAQSTEATGIIYDPFSATLVFAAFGIAHQIDPANPGVVLASRDDGAAGENYLALVPDGMGHLLATRYGGDAALVLIDYSASGRLDDVTTRYFAAPIPSLTGLSGGIAYDPVIFADGLDP
ncbi:MAG: hypothetical protein WBV61_07910 [Rhodanobacteraceae bacterium]